MSKLERELMGEPPEFVAIDRTWAPLLQDREARKTVPEPVKRSEDVWGYEPALLPVDSAERKNMPIATGVIDYFPLALAEVAKVSVAGNAQHNPGQPLHWAKEKSTDHADCIARHLVDRGKFDKDGMRHSAKLAWRALALLEMELESK